MKHAIALSALLLAAPAFAADSGSGATSGSKRPGTENSTGANDAGSGSSPGAKAGSSGTEGPSRSGTSNSTGANDAGSGSSPGSKGSGH